MGSVVPFPVRRTQGDPREGEAQGVRTPPPERSGEVVILPVVQRVRPARETLPPVNVPAGDSL
ncbi:hypothetical protein ACO2RV_01955 [Ancylobacter sp. VNQ12]|uniref:hypothetical protein n=1 Tax=Ancylobacter sp. VNQ12 TaxID=3400920 RepID=UPI003C0C6936